ncbi:hypothetical protein ACFWNT_31195 [Streptomyces sp. NPDC058409]|uniref:hypothetical protein n=1 Tax=Streptomyces sp. NPDC058409 TaxID=3346484 RepID=UPI0036590052
MVPRNDPPHPQRVAAQRTAAPYWGLPQSSVDRIAQGGVQAEIDWVRVEQKK